MDVVPEQPTQARQPFPLRLAHLWLLFPLVLVFALEGRDVIETGDFWWNAKSGQWMIEQRQLLRQDILIYTPGREGPYYNPQWLAQLILYLAYAAGPPVLLFLRAAIFTFVIGLGVWQALRRSNSCKLASMMGVLALFTGLSNFGLRPQMLIFPLFSTYYFLLFGLPYHGGLKDPAAPSDDTLLAERGTRWGFAGAPLMPHLGWKVFLLPVLMLFWVNTHGSFFLGIALIVIYVLSTLFDHLPTAEGRTWLRSSEALRQGAGFLLTVAAVFVNPYGFGIIDYVLVATGDPTARKLNLEWQPPTLETTLGRVFFLSVLVFLWSIYYSRRRFTLADAILSLGFLGFGLLAIRNVIWWALICGPIIAANFAYRAPDEASEPGRPATEERPLLNYLVLGVFLLIVVTFVPFWRVPLLAKSEDAYYDSGRPKGIADYLENRLKEGKLDGRIFNYMEWGGYLGYRLYPQKQVFIDGRFEARNEQVWVDYIHISKGHADWQELLRKPEYGDIRFLVLDRDYQKDLVPLVKQSKEWELVYPSDREDDEHGYVFERKKQ